ncbi:FliM/FliN family flagellar motor switch protein [Tropicimonas sediminicola]|uniref:Flagellar motor switch protein FliM n=1 Tax=Tropicimonas sediminicola TaxID=1031541 RepID=A0A239FCM6_9RHOB|nr:FliM/FliN family flagellar motor switch protein [Tropicimonas sediminicola]SNS54669.1 flagellar motor switch protein FliM [Tropicimonas sediminicola]
MAETEAQSVLQRMASAGRDAAPRSQAVLPARALANGISRALQSTMSLGAVANGSSDRTGSLAELLELLPENGLLAVLDGPGETQGLMALDNALLSSLIEMQMTGSLGNRPPPPRRVTRTDAALVADLIDDTLREFEAPFMAGPEAAWAAGFGYASHVEDVRPLGLLLEDQDYRLLTLDLDLAEGQRTGSAVLALPAEGRGLAGKAAVAQEPPRDARWESAMEAAVMGADVRLEAIMHRVRMPFAKVALLKEGDEIPLPAVSIDQVRLIGLEGGTCAIGRLGQSRGNRALRLNALGDLPGRLEIAAEALAGAPQPGLPHTAAPFEPVAVAGGAEPEVRSTPQPVSQASDANLPTPGPLPMAGLPPLSDG